MKISSSPVSLRRVRRKVLQEDAVGRALGNRCLVLDEQVDELYIKRHRSKAAGCSLVACRDDILFRHVWEAQFRLLIFADRGTAYSPVIVDCLGPVTEVVYKQYRRTETGDEILPIVIEFRPKCRFQVYKGVELRESGGESERYGDRETIPPW